MDGGSQWSPAKVVVSHIIRHPRLEETPCISTHLPTCPCALWEVCYYSPPVQPFSHAIGLALEVDDEPMLLDADSLLTMTQREVGDHIPEPVLEVIRVLDSG